MYNSQDKFEMTCRQARVDLGQSMGNSTSNAVLWVKDNPIYKELKEEELLNKIYELAEQFSHFSQTTIDKKYSDWLELNEEELKTNLGLVDKVINVDKDYSDKLEM
jgi:hypothetical protein